MSYPPPTKPHVLLIMFTMGLAKTEWANLTGKSHQKMTRIIGVIVSQRRWLCSHFDHTWFLFQWTSANSVIATALCHSGLGVHILNMVCCFRSGWILIDRSGKHFGSILCYLRDGTVTLPKGRQAVQELLAEAKYYLIQGLVELCQNTLQVSHIRTGWFLKYAEKNVWVHEALSGLFVYPQMSSGG